ncbi:MAG: peptidase M3, partial [Pseudomonadota bacterium]|nr:peptidase M3 [Pseudomonadota bacterium]
MTANPFFETWTAPFGAPPFDRIKPEHFRPAYERALVEHEAEIAAIAGNTAAPSFANTIAALENSGRLLSRVGQVFHNLASSDTSEALMEIEREMAPRLAQHANAIHLNAALFARIEALHAAREALGLNGEEMRVLERYHLDFVRAGARLGEAEKARYAALTERLATLGTQFAQNVLADEQDTVLPLAEADLAGLPDFARAAAAETARERGLAAPYAATTSRSSVEPILQFADRREVREKLYKAWVSRGDNGGTQDNNKLIEEIVALRVEEAQLLGYASFADY